MLGPRPMAVLGRNISVAVPAAGRQQLVAAVWAARVVAEPLDDASAVEHVLAPQQHKPLRASIPPASAVGGADVVDIASVRLETN